MLANSPPRISTSSARARCPDHLGIIITSVKENEIVAEFTVAQSSGAERFPACRQRGHAG
jgi:hypothetical protein